jgi:hypothetical protein
MKKIASIVITILTYNLIYAQQKQSITPSDRIIEAGSNQKPFQTRLGIFAGPNLNYLDYYDKVTTIDGSNTSFHAGIFYQKNINKYFALQPALLFSIRGGNIKNIDSTINAGLMNIELPINFLYLCKRLMVGAGPNFWYGISGNLKSNGTKRNAYDVAESFERTLKRFEFGGNFIIGYTFKKGILITTNFSPGFTNIYKGDGSAPSNVKAKTSILGISLGYVFGISNGK